MSDKNIDKDIEEFKQELINSIEYIQEGTGCSEGFSYTCFGEGDIEQALKIIEELEKKKLEIKRLREDYLLLQKSSEEYEDKLEAELETYKKIAEKLAEEVEKCSLDNKEYILDWARKEVEKDE